MPPPIENAPTVSLRQALWFWVKLGLISFGGPAGHIAIMHTELVERRRWISDRRFLHALNYCYLIPGPAATQLAIYIGWLMHRTTGGIAAGLLFLLPSVCIMLGLSYLYLAFGNLPAVAGIFAGIKPAVVAVVAYAALRIGSRAISYLPTATVAGLALISLWLGAPFPLIILAAGILGLLGAKLWPQSFAIGAASEDESGTFTRLPAVIDDDHAILPHAHPRWRLFFTQLIAGLVLWIVPLAMVHRTYGSSHTLTEMSWFFSHAALLTFGGAYAVLPYVSDYAISHQWLRAGQMIDGLALGETTPGPLIKVVALVGFIAGSGEARVPIGGELNWSGAVLGGVLAAYFTFLPSFVLILLGAPFIERMRGEPRLTAILSGISAAVVGMVLHLAISFGQKVFLVDGLWQPRAMLIAAVAFLAIWKFQRGILPVLIACGLAGYLGSVWL